MPEMVAHLPDKFDLPKPGLVETVDEVPSISYYYDGSNNLNVKTLHCTIFANPKECLIHSRCGWCGETKQCILGNNLGPQESCKRSSYIYSAPYEKWDNRARIIAGEFAGPNINTLVTTP